MPPATEEETTAATGTEQQHTSEELLAAAAQESMRARAKKAHACLGVVRLDYDYPPAPGDIDSPESFGYDVFYRAVPGLSFEMCQSGKLTEEVEEEFIKAIKWLDETKKVSAITGDCGFMMWFQELARKHTHKPVFMSSLVQLPAITAAYAKHEDIAIFTANSVTLKPMNSLIEDQCGVNPEDTRFHIVGCQDVPGFEAVAIGGKVDVEKVTPGIVALADATLKENPTIRAILLECTELPPYADALRHSTGLPVYDAITCSNMFLEGLIDNPRFGISNWHESWDGVQETYHLGKNLTETERSMLQSVPKEE